MTCGIPSTTWRSPLNVVRRTLVAEKHWKEQWEDGAGVEYEELCLLPLEELGRRIAKRQFGGYYMIWDAISAKQDLLSVGWPLFDFLKSPSEYLHRYHCARALLALMNSTEFQAADLSVEHVDRPKNLARVAALLERALGPRPTTD